MLYRFHRNMCAYSETSKISLSYHLVVSNASTNSCINERDKEKKNQMASLKTKNSLQRPTTLKVIIIIIYYRPITREIA